MKKSSTAIMHKLTKKIVFSTFYRQKLSPIMIPYMITDISFEFPNSCKQSFSTKIILHNLKGNYDNFYEIINTYFNFLVCMI